MTPSDDECADVDDLAIARAFRRIDALIAEHPGLVTPGNLDRLRFALILPDDTDT